MKQEIKNLWVPLRRSPDDGHEFFLLSEIGFDRDEASRHGDKTNQDCGPYYGKDNKIVRIANVDVTITERV